MIGDRYYLPSFDEADAEALTDEIIENHKDKLIDVIHTAVLDGDQMEPIAQLAQLVTNELAEKARTGKFHHV